MPFDAATIDVPASALTGIPCDVASIIASRCASCHSGATSSPSPLVLTSYDTLTATTTADPSMTVAQVALARMNDDYAPMPPAPGMRVPQGEIDVFAAWIANGYPTGSCGDGDGGVIDAGPDPYDTPTVCTTGTNWLYGDHGSQSMHPGRACISCHTAEREGPRYKIAGTVYETAHEPDNCNGGSTSGSAQVIIVGADGAQITLNPNSVGNFFWRSTIALPYTAKVVRDGRERIMATPQMNGDCNTCHTLEGSSMAPGRIMLP